jgi:ABC-type polysaccharide/polyol phosphate export permease
MSAITITAEIPAESAGDTRGAGRLDALRALTGRRLSLSLRNPRAILLPLATPLLIALVIAPALAKVAGPVNGIDYMTYLAIGTAGLLVPLSAMQAGLGVIVDRKSGAQPDLMAAPVPRPFLVLANLLAALVASGLQLAALVAFSIIRGASFHASVAGMVWFTSAAVALAVATYGIAETMANRIGEEEEYVNTIPTIGIAPWFFAGSLFSIHALPSWLTLVAKLLPVTHAVALMRYGAGLHATDLHAIWGLTDPTAMAALSLGVLVLYALGFMYLAVRVFIGTTVR